MSIELLDALALLCLRVLEEEQVRWLGILWMCIEIGESQRVDWEAS